MKSILYLHGFASSPDGRKVTALKALQYYVLLGRRVRYLDVLNVVVVQNSVSNFVATGAGIASSCNIEHSLKS